MRIKKITMKTLGMFAVATVLVSLASCNKNEKFNAEENKVAMTFVAEIDGAGTKAEAETEKTAFEENDAVGIIPVYPELGPLNPTNFKYKYNGIKFEAENLPYYFQDRDEVTFCAYYPYDANLYTGNGSSAYTIVINTKDRIETDYLYAEATTTVADPSISYTGDKAFKHVMAKLTIKLKSGDGIGELTDDNTTVSVGNFIHKGGFIVFYGEVGHESIGGENTPAPFSFAGPTHSHLLIPQSLLDENGENTDEMNVTVTYGGVDYNATLKITTKGSDGNYALLAGTHYTYTITVKNTGLVIGSAEIKDWNEETATGDALL